MKRPASGELIADSGTSKPNDGTAAPPRLGLLITTAESARRALSWLAARAVDRSLSPGSLAAMSLLLAVCAAAWLSGGGRGHGARGLLAMSGWLLFLIAARGLAAFKDRGPTLTRSGADIASATESGALSFGWLAAVCAIAAECAIYGGMAADIERTSLIGPWPLAVLTVSAVGITEMLRACRSAVLSAERRREFGRNPILRAAGALLGIPPALRGLIAFTGYAVNGPRIALLAVLGVETIAIAATIMTLGRITPSAASAAKAAAPKRSAPATTITAVVGKLGSPGETTAVRYTTTPSAAWTAVGRPRRRAGTGTESLIGPAATSSRRQSAKPDGEHAPGTAAVSFPAYGRAMILALRDDGAAARWAGRLVQGNLIPLPPALAGVIATAMLGALGLRNLPAFIALTPPVVMMLAAPGSSHPHDSRFDWLVPVLLTAAQFAYLGPLGFSLALPGPIVFSLCAVIAIWYTSNAAIVSGSSAAGSEPGWSRPEAGPAAWVGWGAGLGWETRMFVIGFAATFGLATFGYLALAAYLGVLICREAMTGYLVLGELTDDVA